jgi:outer membrane receptor protein involved in Fe transport
MNKASIIRLILIFAVIFVSANFALANGRIKGIVLDAQTDSPLPYATVSILNQSDSLITGVITDESGSFVIDKIPVGNFVLLIRYIGYKEYNQSITIDKKNHYIELGSITLEEELNTMAEVEVRGEASEISLKLDKKVFTVGKDVLTQSGSATEVLANVPSVNVSPSGVVSLRGNSGVTILINGRRSGLTSTEALQQIPAENIDRVEVITNPSARYDASGTAGIINIILRKNVDGGLSGQIWLISGLPTDLRGIGSINYRSNKVNIFADLGIRYTDYYGRYSRRQQTFNEGQISKLHQTENESRHDDGQYLYFGMDYYLNENNSLTVAYLRNQTQDSDETNINYLFSSSAQQDSALSTTGNSLEKRNYNQLEINYTKRFSKKLNSQLTVDLQYDFWNSNKDWEIVVNSLEPTNELISNLRTSSSDRNNDVVLQSDFVTSIGEGGKLELGVKAENRLVANTFIAEEMAEGDFQSIDGFNNEIDYSEKIFAGYAQYGNQIGKFGYLAGLRYETTNIDIDSKSDYNNSYSINNFFPSINLSLNASKKVKVQASYSKRINRPYLWQLNPFPQLSDFNSRFFGNPQLRPAFADALELSSLINFKDVTFSPSVYYTSTQSTIEYFTTQNNDGIFNTTLINLDQENRLGLELATTYTPLAWLDINGEFNIYRYRQEGNFSSQDLDFSDQTWYTQLGIKLTPIKNYSLQAQYFYQGPKDIALRKTKSISSLNLGLNRNILNNKGSLTLKVNNLLDTNKDRETILSENFRVEQISNFSAFARWTLSFKYKFDRKGNFKQRGSQRSNRN